MNEMILAQYAKWPRLGKVKTRIGKVLGPQKALAIHLELVKSVLEQFSNVKGLNYQLWLDTMSLRLDQSNASNELLQLIESNYVACREQEGSNLGERMCNTFVELSRDFQKIAIIGSDCPNVSTKQLEEVERALDIHDVVIIPAEDGGYVLIAMRSDSVDKVEGNWLQGVRWGGSAALEDTLSCYRQHKLAVYLLSESWDVDQLEDYQRWKSTL